MHAAYMYVIMAIVLLSNPDYSDNFQIFPIDLASLLHLGTGVTDCWEPVEEKRSVISTGSLWYISTAVEHNCFVSLLHLSTEV